jgi:hypothetical protein
MSSRSSRRGGGDLYYHNSLTPPQCDALYERLAGLTPGQAQQILDELSGRLTIAQVRNPLRYCAVLIKRLRYGKFSPELGLGVVDARHAEFGRQALRARFESVAAIEASTQGRALPPRQRDAIRRIRTISSACPRKNG